MKGYWVYKEQTGQPFQGQDLMREVNSRINTLEKSKRPDDQFALELIHLISLSLAAVSTETGQMIRLLIYNITAKL